MCSALVSVCITLVGSVYAQTWYSGGDTRDSVGAQDWYSGTKQAAQSMSSAYGISNLLEWKMACTETENQSYYSKQFSLVTKNSSKTSLSQKSPQGNRSDADRKDKQVLKSLQG